MEKNDSHKQILKSTSIFGGVQIIIILAGIIKSKVIAVLFGAQGIGVLGIYQSIVELVKNFSVFGLNYSSVTEISKLENEDEKQAELRNIIFVSFGLSSVLGSLILLSFSWLFSKAAFGNNNHTINIALLSIAVLFSILSMSILSILQGMRKIKALASANFFSTILGLGLSIFIYYVFGFSGIMISMISSSVLALAVSIYFYRNTLHPKKLSFQFPKVSRISPLFKAGSVIMIAGLTETLTIYIVRAFISKDSGLDSVGFFMGAWSISTIYLSAILGAMGTDFFPRLSSLHDNNKEFNRLIIEQTEMALLLAAPVIVFMLSFVRPIIYLLYSPSFDPSSSILIWQLFGDFFKILSWPLGFALLARGLSKHYLVVNVFWNVLYFGIMYFTWSIWGLTTTGISFLSGLAIWILPNALH